MTEPSQSRGAVPRFVTRRPESSPAPRARSAVLVRCPPSAVARPLHHAIDVRTHAAVRGFTLIELMVTVAVIGVLAAIAYQNFSGVARKTRGSEVNAVFAELRQRQEEYHLANGVYLSTGSTENDLFPATPSRTAQNVGTLPASWISLKVRLANAKLHCGYVVMAGAAGSGAGIGAKATEFGMPATPTTDWYYLLARCNLAGSSAVDSFYFSWSGDTAVKKQNEGR